MTQGLTRAQLGVTDAMIATYGEVVFRLSNNHQIRRGDPIRDKDFDAIDAHRGELGMSDAQIAARVGLSAQQVTLIRNLEERRRFRTGEYYMLNKLGGGKRFRADRMTPFADHFRYDEAALEMRAGFAFDPDRVRTYVEAGHWNGDTLAAWLARNADTRPDATALIDADGTVTWAQLQARVSALAGGLFAAGIQPGNVVAVQLPNGRAYVEAFLAITALGAVMTTLYMTFRDKDLRHQLRHSGARMLIAPPEIGDFRPVDWALQARADLPALQNVLTAGAAVAGALRLEDLYAGADLPRDRVAPTAADPFLLLYTSGTTSSPKGVPLNSHQMLCNARAGVREHAIGPQDVVLSAAPYGHLYALYSLEMAICAGAATALLPIFTPPGLVDALARFEPTHLFAGPAHLAACRGAGLLDKMHLDSLRVVVLSGAAVPPELVRHVAPYLANGAITQLWGMTELQAGLYTRPGDPLDTAATSAGRAAPGVEVRIADETGTPVPNGQEGEVQVRGPSVFAGYYRNPEATDAAFAPGSWFRSGDIARMDDAGNVTLSGRVKDVINRGGVKYNPQEVELLIEARADVLQCAIAPVPDDRLGERACCYLVPVPGSALTLEALCADLLAQGVAKYKLPERLELRTDLPLTATRKVIKARLGETGD